MHESDAGHDAQNSWPVGISGLGVGVTDQPGTGGLADAALTEAPAPATGPSNTTAAPMATAARHIRPRIANPPLPGKSCSQARVTADKPEQQQPTPGGALHGNQGRPAPLRAKRCTEAKSPSMSGPASLSWLILAFASMGSPVTRRYGPLPGRADLPVQSSWAAVRHRRRSAACGDEGAGPPPPPGQGGVAAQRTPIRRSGGEEPQFPPSRAVICTAWRLTCDIRPIVSRRCGPGRDGSEPGS